MNVRTTTPSGTTSARAYRLLRLVALARRVVDGLVVPEATLGTGGGQARQVLQRRLRRDRQRQRRRIRGDHEIVGQATLEAEPGHAERLVLVRVVPVAHVVGRFGDAPRHSTLSSVLHLARHGAAIGGVEQRVREGPHQQRRHQVLEHRRAPRQERGHAVDAHRATPEMEPVPLGHVAAGDRDEAGQPGLGRQQVVVRHVEDAGALGIREAVPDRELVPRAVVEEPERHLVGERAAALREVQQRRPTSPDAAAGADCPPAGPEGDASITRTSAARRARAQAITAGSACAVPSARPRCSGCASGGESRASRFARHTPAHAARPPVSCAGAQVGQHARGDGLEALDDRRMLEGPGGAAGGHLADDGGGVGKPVEQVRVALRTRGPLLESTRQGHERRHEVAAVHGRDVARPQRGERRRVVPVEQMPLVPLEPLAGVEGVRGAFDQLAGRDEAEVARGEGREQTHADVGGRRAAREVLAGRLLEVVGRQPVIVGTDEHLEVVPGLAGEAAQLRAAREGPARAVSAHAAGSGRRR